MATKRKSNTRGKRYTEKERCDAIEMVREYNKDNIRGGLTYASKQLSISQVTLRGWLNSTDIDTGCGEAAAFRRLAKLADEVDALKRQFSAKEKEYNDYKASLF